MSKGDPGFLRGQEDYNMKATPFLGVLTRFGDNQDLYVFSSSCVLYWGDKTVCLVFLLSVITEQINISSSYL